MATYIELRELFNNSNVKNKVITGTIIAAQQLASGTPTAADNAWISSVLSNPATEGNKAFIAVLAANESATVAQIEGATDANIQIQVDAIVPILVNALAGV